MIQDSIAKKAAIAICFVPEGSQEIRPIAGYGYPQIIESRADGTLIIFINCIGKTQLDLQNLKSVDPYIIAEGQVIEEEHAVLESHQSDFSKLRHFYNFQTKKYLSPKKRCNKSF